MSTRRYLVTGGLGFLGAALTRSLVHDGHTVRVLDDTSRGSLHRLGEVAADVEVRSADIRDLDAVVASARGVDTIAHLAYVNGTRHFYERPAEVLDVGVRGMLNVLDACRACGVGDLAVASSSEVYQSPPVVPTDETVPLSVPDPLNPRYSYGGGKIICELLALNHGRTGFERVVVFRPHNVYGPDMGWDHVVPELTLRIDDLRRCGPGPVAVPIQGTGDETRAFVYVEDFTAGLRRVLDAGEHLGIYHVGTDTETTVRDLVAAIAAAVGVEATVVAGPAAPGATPRRCPDIAKLRALGYEPRWQLTDGLRVSVDWYLTHRPVTKGATP